MHLRLVRPQRLLLKVVPFTGMILPSFWKHKSIVVVLIRISIGN